MTNVKVDELINQVNSESAGSSLRYELRKAVQAALAEKDARIKELEALVATLSGQLPREEKIDILAKAIQLNTIAQQQLAAKDAQLAEYNQRRLETVAMCDQLTQELARVARERDEYRTLNEHHKDEFLTANLKLARVMQAHDTLLGEAVWAMTYVKFFIGLNRHEFSQLEADKVEAFLSRPDVREWQDRQKEGV